MAYLNINIPPIECLVRKEYLLNLESGFGEYYNCMIFGMMSVKSQTPLFHSILEDGGIFWKLPISAFCWKQTEHQDLDELVLWDSFSSYPSVTMFDVLKHKKVNFFSRRKNKYSGDYLFTIDWGHEDDNICNLSFVQNPGQHKCGHFIKLENGNFAIQPNNRLKFFDPSFCTKQDILIERKINTHIWSVEQTSKWLFEDSENYDYDIYERKLKD